MIIDADCHISPTPEGGVSITVEELLRRMDAAGIEKAVTWLQPPYDRDIERGNRYVYEATRRYPDRILGFGWADPNQGVDKARDMVKRCIYDYGFYGVKLNGAQNDFFIDDEKITMPVIEEIAGSGKLIAFHCGVDAYEKTHPFRIAKIARRFPQMQILCVHMGGVGMPEMSNAVIETATEHHNMTLIGSMVHHTSVLKAVIALGAERVCFGSDTPFALMDVCVAAYNALLGGRVSDGEKGLIMSGNIARLFGLQS